MLLSEITENLITMWHGGDEIYNRHIVKYMEIKVSKWNTDQGYI